MKIRIIEATNGIANWGKFLVGQFDKSELTYVSGVDAENLLIRSIGRNPDDILVVDLQTGEGAFFNPRSRVEIDLNEKHQIWVCPLYAWFLVWLCKQDLDNIDALPAVVDLPNAPFELWGHRRKRANVNAGGPEAPVGSGR